MHISCIRLRSSRKNLGAKINLRLLDVLSLSHIRAKMIRILNSVDIGMFAIFFRDK